MNAEDRMIEHAERLQKERDQARTQFFAVQDEMLKQRAIAEAGRRVYVLLSKLDLSVPMGVVGALIELRDAITAYDTGLGPVVFHDDRGEVDQNGNRWSYEPNTPNTAFSPSPTERGEK